MKLVLLALVLCLTNAHYFRLRNRVHKLEHPNNLLNHHIRIDEPRHVQHSHMHEFPPQHEFQFHGPPRITESQIQEIIAHHDFVIQPINVEPAYEEPAETGVFVNCTAMTSCVGCGLALNQCYWNTLTHRCIPLPEDTLPQDIYDVCPVDEIAIFEQQLMITIFVAVILSLMCCVCCVRCCCPSRRQTRRRRGPRPIIRYQPIVQQPVQIPMTYYYVPPTPGNYVQPVYGLGQSY